VNAEGNEIRLTGKVVAGTMLKHALYIKDEREFTGYPSPSLYGLKWQEGDAVEIIIRRTATPPKHSA
jgi:hypothetical protein